MISHNSQDRSRLGGLAIALVLAFAAQYLFTGEVFTRYRDSNTWEWQPQYTIGSLLLLAALGCAAWALAPYSLPQAAEKTSVTNNLNRYYKIAIGGGLVCYVLTLAFYILNGEDTLVRWLWVAGMGALVVPLWLESRTHIDSVRLLWWEVGLAGAITVLGFFLRYWQLTEIPSAIHHDIPLMGEHALRLIESNNFNWVGFSTSAHLLSYDQSIAWSMRLFGTTQYGLVMKSVLFGTLSLPLTYLLGREMFNSRVGLIAMFLLAVNYTHIHFSRTMFGPSVTFFALLIFYLIYRGLRTKTSIWYALAGIATGLGVLLYDSGRVVPVIAGALIGWRLLWDRELLRGNLLNWCIFLLGALVGFGPMLAFAITDFNEFMGRGNSVMIWTPIVWDHAVNTYGVDSAWGIFVEQAKRVFLAFHLYGDGSPHFAFPRPGVSALVAALFVIGMGYALLRLKQPSNFIVVSWYFFTFMLGGLLTYDPPFWPHLNIALPAIMLIAALAADRIIAIWSPPKGEFGHLTIRLVMLGLLAYTGYTNWDAYYNYGKDNGGPRIRAVRFINGLPDGYHVYLISNRYQWTEWQFQFFNHDVFGSNLALDAFQSDPPTLDIPLAFIVYDQYEILPLLREQYPNGTALEHRDAADTLVFTTYTVAPPGFQATAVSTTNRLLRLPGWWFVAGGALIALVWAFRHLQRRPVEVTPSSAVS
jgi:4-amino-4-deoxy-L-arabinose transferase-like glycosyltransferase